MKTTRKMTAGSIGRTSLLLALMAPAAGFVQSQAQELKHPAEGTGATLLGGAATEPVHDFASSLPAGETIHMRVGRSLFVNTKHRLTRIYITNPAVVDSYTASPNQVLLTAKAAGTSSVVVWDENGGSESFLISADISIESLRASLKEALPNEKIDVAGDEGRIVLSGQVSTDGTVDAALKLAGLYSKDVSNALIVNSATVKQVRLKVRIIEVDRSKLNQFAFNFFSTGGNNLASTSTNQFASSLNASAGGAGTGSTGISSTAGNKTVSVTNALNFLLYSSKYNVGAMLQDLETRQVLQILAEPTISAMSGQKANFLAGGEFPFPIVQGGTVGLASISIQFRPYGVKVEFTPTVNPDGSIQLKVAPEVSALDYTNAVMISGYTIPALSTRRADTQVVLKNGQSFAISGLLDKRTTDSYSKTPGIASVPILGQLFKSKSVNHSTTELLVIVTPTIVDPAQDPMAVQEPNLPVPILDDNAFDADLPKVAVAPKAAK